MFCPQCRAEYREGIVRCADCDLELVSSLATEETGELEVERATEILWEGDDPILFQAVKDALNGASLPFLAGFSRNMVNPDLAQFLALPARIQFFVRVSRDTLSAAQGVTNHFVIEPTPMLCPLCKSEVFADFGKCEDCSCPLVSMLAQVAANPPVAFWWGTSQERFQSLLDALQSSEIPCHGFQVYSQADQTGGLGWLDPKISTWVGRTPTTEFVVCVRRDDTDKADWAIRSTLHDGTNGQEPEITGLFRGQRKGWVEVFFSTPGERVLQPFEDLEEGKIDFDILPDFRGYCYWFVPPGQETRAREILQQYELT